MTDKKESFIVSARKYRPSTWAEVVGQEAITDTLKNAIEQGQLAHAYLFCGPRGVGKTTCARIFAKEINASDDHPEDEDFSFNIFELDAASNNSVNDIRSLTDQVRIPPQVGRYKVYIIDEVHMLSTQAFNAFLKTLEEPPKHAIFILATTEKHKIIPTILSRCQIYDFNRIGVGEIVSHLRAIASNEGVRFEEEALHVIGQKADGALRDALSIFDQLSSFTNRNLTYEAVLKNLHVLDYDYYFRVTDHLYSGDYASALVTLDEILRLGFDGAHFMAGLGTHLRDLLVCKDPATIALLEVGETVKGQYQQQARSVESTWIIDALKHTNQAEFRFRNTLNQRLLIEVTLLTLASLQAEKKKTDHGQSIAPATLKEPARPVQQTPPAKPATNAPAAQPAVTREEQPVPEVPERTAPLATAEPAATPAPPPGNPAPKQENETELAARKRKSRLTTISLSSIDKAPESPAEKTQVLNEPEGAYQPSSSQPSLAIEKAWEVICGQSLEKGQSALYSILVRQNAAGQCEGTTLTVQLLHDVEEEEFGHHRTDVLQQLRMLTGNADITLKSLTIQASAEKKLFSAREKFEYLAQKNPKIIKLKEDLDLDISY